MQIQSAAERGEIDAIRYCLSRGVPVDQRLDDQETALLTALRSMNRRSRQRPSATTETIRFLLDAGADPTANDQFGRTALEFAVCNESLEQVQLLCERGADRSLKNSSIAAIRSTLIHRDDLKPLLDYLTARGLKLNAAEGGLSQDIDDTLDRQDFASLKRLLESQTDVRPKNWNPVHEMLVIGSPSDLRHMAIPEGALQEAVGRYDYTPFLLAVAMNDPAKAEVLLECGASLFEKAWAGRSALHVAVECGRPAMLPWLIDRGIPVDFAEEIDDTPLMWACNCDRSECVAVLLERGASGTFQGRYGKPIHEANSLEVTRLLVERGGAEINEVNSCGEWPLKGAAFSGDYEWAKWLLEHGAEVDLTSTGETALYGAVFVDAREVVRLLLENGANPNALDVDGNSPFHNVHSREMVELLRSFGGDPAIYHGPASSPKRWVKDPLIQELL